MVISMIYKTVQDVWDAPRTYPTIAYIETTNHCNFHCKPCPVDRHTNPKGFMSLDEFKFIADKIKARGIKIGAIVLLAGMTYCINQYYTSCEDNKLDVKANELEMMVE